MRAIECVYILSYPGHYILSYRYVRMPQGLYSNNYDGQSPDEIITVNYDVKTYLPIKSLSSCKVRAIAESRRVTLVVQR